MHKLVDHEAFAHRLTETSVHRREKPVRLPNGTETYYDVDFQQGLSDGSDLSKAARLMLELIDSHELETDPNVAASISEGGLALAVLISLMRHGVKRVHGNDRTDNIDFDGYGLRGAKVDGAAVLAVTDITITGNSLAALCEMVAEAGGNPFAAVTLLDRSDDSAKRALKETNLEIGFYSIFEFDEARGLITPVGVRV